MFYQKFSKNATFLRNDLYSYNWMIRDILRWNFANRIYMCNLRYETNQQLIRSIIRSREIITTTYSAWKTLNPIANFSRRNAIKWHQYAINESQYRNHVGWNCSYNRMTKYEIFLRPEKLYILVFGNYAKPISRSIGPIR